MRGFKFAEFDAQCAELDVDQLQLKWQHYTRALSAASTSTAVATLTAGPTGGVSMIGAMIAGPLMHNARKKRQIVEKHMTLKGSTPETRKKDIYGPAMLSGVLGGATFGVSMGAEALAVEKVTKIVSHAVIDGALAKAEDKHAAKEHAKEVSAHEGQLTRSSSMPAIVPAIGSENKEKMVGVLLKHANTLPGSLGSSANGLIASASRMRAEKYPLLKEYISSIATQSRGYMSFSKPGGNGLSPAGRNWTEPATRSEVDSDPLPSSNSHVTDHSQPPQEPVGQTFVAELEGDSYYSSSIVSPIGSSIAEMDSEYYHGSVSPCETTYSPSEVEGNHAFDNLFKTMDETAISEIENELELAIQEMDDTTADFKENNDKRTSRAFHSPTDLDTITDSKSSCKKKWEGGQSEPSSPTGTILPAYAETDPSIAPEVCFTNTGSSSVISSNTSNYQASTEKECVVDTPPAYMRGGGLSHSESTSSTASSSRLIMSDPNSPQLVVRSAPTEDYSADSLSTASWTTSKQTPELVEPSSPVQSKMGKRAMSAHNGMKKVGYFGLEPAAKLAVGGSLLLMGVRPSVQRKMLDKAKSKMGMPDKERRKDEDDDYRDYI
ncbi:hypothetical protein N0V93_009789 [Gnomoniopsis smithogilvyi]|uniref:Uncharacterized protein n=1 Tax=Gnomoniopsis smithogilvyi TaxID=1191159 RepID=A0A9W9CT05_9PEZI|nr:hypothetical protein N0V93_009789 [Gnomoniopsis smithogilvyi]